MTTATKYLVVSYDSDEQQTFWDWVLAVDATTAREFVMKHRPYVDADVDALWLPELQEMARQLDHATPKEIGASMKELVDQLKEIHV